MSTQRPLGERYGNAHTASGRNPEGGDVPARSIEITPKAARYLLEQSLDRIARSWEKPA